MADWARLQQGRKLWTPARLHLYNCNGTLGPQGCNSTQLKTAHPPVQVSENSFSQDMSEGNVALIVVENKESITLIRQKRKKQKPREKKTKQIMKIQAWWRGTLVRRTLLHAALRAWVIQCWWRETRVRLHSKKRREALESYVARERAVVKLQSLIRMWRIHWRYCQVLQAIYVIQCHWQHHDCHTCAFLRGHCEVTTTHLQFHIEVLNPPQRAG
ncbi:PREDICTED: IQ domain-containing protein F2 [Miniopterus natalensis]|uniref:IQ domain-containing protein F2 n=1 Tax=Miniopterus natalensis TaxID=291302 RepID=UPI0007A7012E|nr:PREDICTED: IQ domain-containing protein F2 [Miniopterus natalensis]